MLNSREVNDLRENINKEKILKKKKEQSGLKNSLTEMKNRDSNKKQRLENAEWISDLEDSIMESNEAKQQKNKNIKN